MICKYLYKSALVFAMAISLAAPAVAEQKAQSLDELLTLVKQGKVKDDKENSRRESEFRQAKNKQINLLKKAKKTRKAEELRSLQLEKTFGKNELVMEAKQEQLEKRLGSLKELFGHLTSAAGDTRSNFSNSLISLQYPNREKPITALIDKMSSSTQLPTIEEIEGLWFQIQREIVESGKVVKFSTTVVQPNGERSEKDVVRIGSFNVMSDGNYLNYNSESGVVEVLSRQPSTDKSGEVQELQSATSGFTRVGIDPTGPTGGSLLSALIDTPTLVERWHQGRVVGYIISAVGVVAMIIALYRLAMLGLVSMKVSTQLKSEKALANNPLGRVLAVHEANPTMDTETLELKIAEAILKEKPGIESGISILKIISMIAPLMGLLGTVTGMIITFQAITIYGAGDPKAMAGGISSALVTTVLGLIVAIPTVLMHTIVNGRAKRVLHIIEEQSMGIIAEHTEAQLRAS